VAAKKLSKNAIFKFFKIKQTFFFIFNEKYWFKEDVLAVRFEFGQWYNIRMLKAMSFKTFHPGSLVS